MGPSRVGDSGEVGSRKDQRPALRRARRVHVRDHQAEVRANLVEAEEDNGVGASEEARVGGEGGPGWHAVSAGHWGGGEPDLKDSNGVAELVRQAYGTQEQIEGEKEEDADSTT
jgi:hypothetical protein